MIISNITIANIPYIVDVKPGIAGSLSFPGGNSGTNMLVLNPGFTPGTGSYTIEGWIRLPNFTSAYGIVGATATNGFSLFVTNSTTFTTDKYGGGGQFSSVSYTHLTLPTKRIV